MSEDKKEKAPDQEKPKKPKKSFRKRILGFAFLLAAIIFYPTTFLFLIGMFPTVLAARTDPTPGKSAGLTVGAMNIAGVIYPLLLLWTGHNNITHSIEGVLIILSNYHNLLFMWGGALIGWMIYDNITPVVAIGVRHKTESRLREIEKEQKNLVSVWGEGIRENAR